MPVTLDDIERAVFGVPVLRFGRIDNEAAVITGARTELLLADLMANGAIDAILRFAAFLLRRIERKMRKDLPEPAMQLGFVARNGHVANGAFVFDIGARVRMVDGFAARAGLPIRIARGVGHHAGAPVEADGNIAPGPSGQAVMAGDAAIGSLESHFRFVFGCARCLREQNGGEEAKVRPHHQPSVSLPSCQSQRT